MMRAGKGQRLSWDIPKGHCEPHESLLQTALRELLEETNVSSTDVQVDQKFVYENVYYPYYKRFKAKVQKTLTVFLGFVRLKAHIKVKISKEHKGERESERERQREREQRKGVY